MRMSFLILTVLLSVPAFGGKTIFSPVREGKSNYVGANEIEFSNRKLRGHEGIILTESILIIQEIESDTENVTYDDFLKKLEYQYYHEFGESAISNPQKLALHENVFVLLRSNELIDDTFYRLLNDYVEYKYGPDRSSQSKKVKKTPPAFTLSEYIEKKQQILKSFNRIAKVKDEEVASTENNPFPIKDHTASARGYKNLSVQDKVFYSYSAQQIKELALIMDFALNVADAKKVYTTIEFRDSDESLVLTHSPTEQYRLGLRLMRMKKEEVEGDPRKVGVPVSDLDLIAAAYIMGVLSHEELNLIVSNKDFYLPKVSFVKKMAKYFGGLAGLAIRVHPVTAPYALVPMLLYNSYMQSKEVKNKIDEEAFIFSIPVRK